MNKNYIVLSITSNDLGKRFDVFLAGKLKYFSRNKIQKLIKDKNVLLNDKILDNRSFKLKDPGDIKIYLPKPIKIDVKPQNLNLKVIFEDKNLLVVDKEAGMVVHPGAGIIENTLVNGLLYHCRNSLSGIGGLLRPGIVHRLDKMTSGIIVIAKDDFTHNELSKQFKNRTIERKYEAIVWNRLLKKKNVINLNIIRSKINRKKMSVDHNNKGKSAVTEYFLIDEYIYNNTFINVIECKLGTGRTHQIRVHMNHNGNPIIGDNIYKRNINTSDLSKNLDDLIKDKFIKKHRHALHAKTLGFFHPHKKKDLYFESKVPDDIMLLKNILNKEKKKNYDNQ